MRGNRFMALAPVMLALSVPTVAQEAQPAAAEAPRNTPGLPDELVGIDEVLTGGLLNDPTSIAWETYGANLASELITDETYPGGGAALRITMRQAGQVYDGGLNIPLLVPIPSGERVTIGFLARTIASDAADGRGRIGVRFQQNRAPYPGFGDTVLAVGPEWGFFEVTAVADQSFASDAIVAIQFGLAAQTVEVGQAIVVSGTSTISD
ncbi:MAG: hypothetical protein JY451_01725 [Erythrobacter sp.]|nr:MAG: hypothetical protein JY451_01725 [Erythrobacter sp.]